MTRFTERAPAKLNLYLHVTGKRDDGYHTLDSLVAFADIGDRVTVETHDGLRLSITGPYAAKVPAGPKNLVLKAATLLAERFGVVANAHITLEKNLPVASGIGGGSADAAATLRALIKLWTLKLADEDLRLAALPIGDGTNTRVALETLSKSWRDDLASQHMGNLALVLGADVPVCFEGRTVYMSGIGEQLCLAPPLPLEMWIVLANPHVGLSTPAVFLAREGGFSDPAPFFEAPADVKALANLLLARRNDLCAPAIALAPQIQEVLTALNQQQDCLLARMSGSGATCFGLFTTQQAAQAAHHVLSQAQPAWWVQTAQLIDVFDDESWL
ncbi:MAG: 4-(cytidine 5'-diphospho)-2-C-methyl-D-erythritol kinase [Magnetovibrio sp.]|nr:4-(cytidine 5'-diphospho)-2-C-methyl-D-erythritol kinase [Magnetovibrio sp.]